MSDNMTHSNVPAVAADDPVADLSREMISAITGMEDRPPYVPVAPKGMSRKYRRAYAKAFRSSLAATSYLMRTMLAPGHARLILPPTQEGQSPNHELHAWGARVERKLGVRIPGNWTTKRGRLKRTKWLFRYFSQ